MASWSTLWNAHIEIPQGFASSSRWRALLNGHFSLERFEIDRFEASAEKSVTRTTLFFCQFFTLRNQA